MGKSPSSRALSHKPTAAVHNMDIMDTTGNHHDGNTIEIVDGSSSCASASSSWNCHTCTFLNKDAHRSTCSFCGAARDGGGGDGGGGTISMSENEDNGEEELMSHGSKHSNDISNNKNSILRRCSTNNSESQQSASTFTSERERGAAEKLLRQQKHHRRPSHSSSGSRLQPPPSPNNNNNNKPSSYRVKGKGRADNNKGTDDDGTSSSGNLINTSDVDSIRLIDSVSKASVSSSRNGTTTTSRRAAGRRGTVPTDDSSTLQSKSNYSRHRYQDETSFRRRRRSHDGGSSHAHSKSEQNIDQEERDIGSNKIWANEAAAAAVAAAAGVKEGKKQQKHQQPVVSSSTKTKSGGVADDDDTDNSKSSSSSSSGSGSITKSGINTAKTLCIPEGNVTIVYTDVQGSTSLWEADPYSMKKATDIHDSIIRRCYSEHGGYEISTEGDSFNLAFQHPADAIGFALRAQLLLYRARWPMALLSRLEMCENDKLKFRGFRVRMGMHHGPTTSRVHKTTGRTIYQGEAVNIAKAIEKMCHGGQILTTVETWRSLSGMAEKFLGCPQVLDCGEHILFDPKKNAIINGGGNGGTATSSSAKRHSKSKPRIISKRIVQLVPNSLSYDFFAARSWQEENQPPVRVCGRVFPPLLSHGQLSTSFFNAPYVGNRVAMVFVYTHKMDKVTDRERKKNYKLLAKYVRSHLMRLYPPGYECQEQKGSWMLAFDRIENGIKFGLDLKEDVIKNSKLYGNVDKGTIFRIGIVWGAFLSMGPHTVSGHADYFGPIVNRAARVAKQCQPGQVCVGVPMGDGDEPPDPGPSVEVNVLGVKKLKGISVEMAIFGCRKR